MSDSETNKGAGGDVKPPKTYEITIVDNANSYPLSVKVKPNTQIVKVLKVWCNHHDQKLNDWVFMLDGERINVLVDNELVKDTVTDIGIDEDCQIDALIHQLGGGR